MLVWIVILGIIGLMLVIAEAFIPGFGIFGIAGGIALISSTVIAGIKYGFGVFLIMIATFIILLLLFVLFAKTKKLYDKFVLNNLLNNDNKLLEMKQNIKKIAKPNSTNNICSLLLEN